MDTIAYVWTVSAVWAAVSLLGALTLVVRRIVIDRMELARQAPRDRVTRLLLQHLDGSLSLERMVADIDKKRAMHVDDVAAELLNMMQGSDRTRLIVALRTLGTVERQIRRLRRGRPRDRVAAATLLSCFDDPAVVPALESQLDHRDASVRMAAAVALAELGAIKSVTSLVDRLRLGASANSRVLFVVFRKLLPEFTLQLVELLHSDVPDFVKALALDAFGYSGDYLALETLILFAGDDSVELRIQTLKALAQLGHPGALPAVERALGDDVAEVRIEAAICAARIGLRETQPLLIKCLGDESWWVRFRAAEALYAFGPRGIAALKKRGRSKKGRGSIARRLLAEKAAA